jgi:F-type H+-transporting ATPase subunit gamma
VRKSACVRARPYAEKIREMAANLSRQVPSIRILLHGEARELKKVGINFGYNRQRLMRWFKYQRVAFDLRTKYDELQAKNIEIEYTAIGYKRPAIFESHPKHNVISQTIQIGDTPHLDVLHWSNHSPC